MDDSAMSNCYVFANREWKARIGVQDGTFLNVRSLANVYQFNIAAQNCAKPNTHVAAKSDTPNHVSIWRNPDLPPIRKFWNHVD
jgi:hypothetical protein